jgi:hypothetical protein
MTRLTRVLAAALACVWLAGATTAQGPPLLTRFNGELTDAAGEPRTGLAVLTFAIYEEPEGGVPLWSEVGMVELDAEGRYQALLGAETRGGLPRELFLSGEARWLGVRVDSEPELPRILLASVPYALKAGDADTLGGLPASAFVRTDPESGAGAGIRGSSRPSARPAGAVGLTPPLDAALRAPEAEALAAAVPSELLPGAITASAYAYDPPRVRYLALDAAAFTSRDSAQEYRKTLGEGWAYIASVGANGALVAPVNLPDGATVTELQAIVRDNSAGSDLSLVLYKRRLTTPLAVAEMATALTAGASADPQTLTDATIVEPVIANDTNSYLVRVHSSSWPGDTDLAIVYVRLTYALGEAQ